MTPARDLTPRFSQMAKADFQANLKRALQAARSLNKHSNKASTSAMIPKILVFTLDMLAQRGVTEDAVVSAMVRRQYPEHGKHEMKLPDDIVEALLKEVDSEDEDDKTVRGESQQEKLCSSDFAAGQDGEGTSGEGVTVEGGQHGDRVTTVS